MKNWIPQKTLIVFLKLTTVFCALIYLLSLVLVLMEIKKIENYYSNIESTLVKEESIRVLKSIAETNSHYLDTLRGFFVQRGDEVKFIEEIEAVGRKSGIKFEISSIDIKPSDSKSLKEDIAISVNMEGSWRSTMSFIDALEKMPFGVLVKKFVVDTRGSKEWTGSIDFLIFKEK